MSRTEPNTQGPRPRSRRLRRLGQVALFSAVRGTAYTIGAAAGGWIIYWIGAYITHF